MFAVVGERHVAALSTPLKFLKHFSRAEIVVLQARSSERAPHDQIIDVALPDELDDHQSSVLLKTKLLEYIGGLGQPICYLDSDVIAVQHDVDTVFDQLDAPIRFARDHVDLDTFSRWAVRCGCRESRCPHLREEILRSLNVNIIEGDWTHWNGGVFLFDERSREFFDTWHRMTLKILGDPHWKTRDQGTLAAAAWALGLEELEPLHQRYNFIVDPMQGIPIGRRNSATVRDFHLRNDYSLRTEQGFHRPRFIHFINGGVGQTGWRHWDEVQALLD